MAPLEIEKCIEGHESVKECVVLGLQDTDGLLKTKAFIGLKEGFKGSGKLSEDIQNFCSEKMASYKAPRQVRNLATVCGNLCNASPAAECAPALLALKAKARIAGQSGQRVIDLKDFFLEPGKTALAHDEILAEIQIPEPEMNTGGIYLKHSTRRIDVAIVGVAVVVQMDGQKVEDIRIALGAVGPTPFREEKAEGILKGQEADEERIQKAAEKASDESFPIDDLRGQKDYRKDMVVTLVKQGIEGAISRAI